MVDETSFACTDVPVAPDRGNSPFGEFIDFDHCEPAYDSALELELLIQMLGEAIEPAINNMFPLLDLDFTEGKGANR